ncbi:MAG: 30S ribosomal protein S17 [Patescibacteria group bacterium]
MKETQRRQLRGTVVSTKMQKTVVVRVDRNVSHPKYHKSYTMSKRYKVHVSEQAPQTGDLVEIEECRPISKDTCWRYVRTLTKAV